MSLIFSALLAATAALPKPTCLPPFWRGILAGGTTRSEVVRLYGEGVYLPDENGFPSSYYVDAKDTVTLHVITAPTTLCRLWRSATGTPFLDLGAKILT